MTDRQRYDWTNEKQKNTINHQIAKYLIQNEFTTFSLISPMPSVLYSIPSLREAQSRLGTGTHYTYILLVYFIPIWLTTSLTLSLILFYLFVCFISFLIVVVDAVAAATAAALQFNLKSAKVILNWILDGALCVFFFFPPIFAEVDPCR